MTERPDRLEPGLAALLDAERNAPSPDATLDRVWTKVEKSVVGAATSSGRPSPGPSTGEGLASHGVVALALAFAVGGATGAAATVLLRRPVERIVYVDRPRTTAALAPAMATSSTGAVPDPVAPTGVDRAPLPPPRWLVPRATPSPSASSLPAERALLDRARNALTRSDGASAIALTDEHARRFAHPQLREEREAIAIQAMVLEGRYDQARARAKQFRATSPDSLFLPAVDASLASIPDANP